MNVDLLNILFQISIGLAPMLFLILIVLIIKRALCFEYFVSIILFMAVGVLTCIIFARNLGIEHINDDVEQKRNIVALAEGIIKKGALDDASELVNEYSQEFGYDDNCRYIFYLINEAKGEKELAKLLDDEINEMVINSETDFGELTTSLYNIDKYGDAYSLFDSDLNTINEYIAKDARLQKLRYIDKILVKASVLKKDYAGLAGAVNNDSSYQRLMAVSDLLIAKKINEDQLSALDEVISQDTISQVSEKVDIIRNEKTVTLNTQQSILLNESVDAIINENKNPKLAIIRDVLSDSAVSKKDESKKYMQLSKIDDYNGSANKSKDSFNNAVNEAYKSDNGEYKKNMKNISRLLHNQADEDDIKNLNNYITSIYEDSFIIDEIPLSSLMTIDKGEDSYINNAISNVAKIKNAIYINDINTEEFPKVNANISFQSDNVYDEYGENQLKKSLEVTDCSDVVDFKLEKNKYVKTDIILALDVSGSMVGKIESLKNATNDFVSGMNKNENISLVFFNSKIALETQFSNNTSELMGEVAKIVADGGTDIYGTTVHCINKFDDSKNTNKVIIVMTDGEDYKEHSKLEIEENINNVAKAKGVTVFTIGFGKEVKGDYLKSLGQFYYGNDEEELKSLFKILHRNVGETYTLSYTAKEKNIIADRVLEVRIDEKGYISKKKYSLVGDVEKVIGDYAIQKIVPQKIYKDGKEKYIELRGDNAKGDEGIIVTLKNEEWEENLKISNKGKSRFVVPKDIASGSYDVVVTIGNNLPIVLPDKFQVFDSGNPKTINYGKNKFLYYGDAEKSDGKITLSGNVVMNDFLHFNGDLVIEGNIDNNPQLTIQDTSGAYIEFDSDSRGLAKFLSDKISVVELGDLGRFTIYKNEEASDEISIKSLEILDTFSLAELKCIICRDHLEFVSANKIAPAFSFIRDIFISDSSDGKKSDQKKNNAFETKLTEFETNPRISNKAIEFSIKTDAEFNGGDNEFKFFNQDKIKLGGRIGIEADTINQQYGMNLYMNFPFFKLEEGVKKSEANGIGVEFGVKDMVLDKLGFTYGLAVTIPAGPVPITLNNFTGKVEQGLSDAIKYHNFDNLSVGIETDIAAGEIGEVIPVIKPVPILGKAKLLSADRTKLNFKLSKFSIDANAAVQALGLIDIGSVEVNIGQFNYDNAVLDINNEDVIGLRVKTQAGLKTPKTEKIYFEMAAGLETTINTKFSGITADGKIKYDINLPVLHKKADLNGGVALGVFITDKHGAKLVFVEKTIVDGEMQKTQFVFPSLSGKLE